MMLSAPLASRALSTTFFMSEGARNCPFLMLTGLPAEATAWMKSVWRQRKAGVCSTSTIAATVDTSSSVCTSVSTGTPTALRTFARISSPCSMPGPRYDFPELRFALSYDDLKTKGMPSSEVMRLSSPATSICNCSDSTTQGPAMRKNGRSSPTSKPHSFMTFLCGLCGLCVSAFQSRGGAADDFQPRLRNPLLVLFQRGLDERREERMAVARRGGEFRV